MTSNYDLLLFAAEELNFTRAAKRAFVSQQYLSNYIRHLEEQYGVTIFQRKPHLSLTPAGSVLVEKFRQLKALESSITQELADIQNEPHGIMYYGTSFGRALSLLPYVLPVFKDKYPHISFVCRLDSTTELEKQAINGDLDLFLGVSTSPNPMIRSEYMIPEQIYLGVSDNLLRQCFPEEYPNCKLRFAAGVDIREFRRVPFIMNHSDNRTGARIFQFLDESGVQLESGISINSNEIQSILAALDMGACFCQSLLIPNVRLMDSFSSPRNQLNFFPVKGLEMTGTISLCYRKDRAVPAYMRYFMDLLKEHYTSFMLYPQTHTAAAQPSGQQ